MSRPVYEREHDRRNQTRIGGALAQALWLELIEAPRLYPCDYAAADPNGKIIAYLEIKARFAEYPTMIISHHKWIDNLAIFKKAGVPSWLVWSFPRGDRRLVLYTPIAAEPRFPVRKGGRIDRGDPRDIEDVVEIPQAAFTFACTMEDTCERQERAPAAR